MPKKRQSILVACRYQSWKLYKRNGVWQGDARSNEINAGRHSLGTRNEKEAMQLVHELDELVAAQIGLIEQKPVSVKGGLTISAAIADFRKDKARPKAAGGVEPDTLKRYNRILNKFEFYAAAQRLKYMTQVDRDFFDGYVEMLEELDFALSSIVTEMVCLKSLHQSCVEKRLLDHRFSFKYPLNRPTESLAYCPTEQEVEEIFRICKSDKSLHWLYCVVFLLSKTGLRFGEARDLEWRDIDNKYEMLLIRDETYLKNKKSKQTIRQTKTRKSRKIPIRKDLAVFLKGLSRQGGRILAGPRGGKLRNDIFGDTLRAKVFPRVVEAVSGDDVERLTAHGFRHYFVSHCANMGVPQLSVMKWLGHSTPRMTNYYYHSNDATSLKHMRQLEAAESSDK